MQREEPTACLVHTFGDEVGRIYLAAVQQLLVLERVVNLRVWHGAGVEPYVNQVAFASHRLSVLGDKDNVVHIRTVQVNLVVVLLRIDSRLEAFLLVRIGGHQTCSNRFFYFIVEFFHGFDTFLLAVVLRAPDGQRGAPVARTAQVPVVQVLQPLAEASRAGAFRFPVDGLVQLHHALLAGSAADEPAIQRVIEHGLVRAPAVRIVVYVLLYLEGLVAHLHHHADDDVQ